MNHIVLQKLAKLLVEVEQQQLVLQLYQRRITAALAATVYGTDVEDIRGLLERPYDQEALALFEELDSVASFKSPLTAQLGDKDEVPLEELPRRKLAEMLEASGKQSKGLTAEMIVKLLRGDQGEEKETPQPKSPVKLRLTKRPNNGPAKKILTRRPH